MLAILFALAALLLAWHSHLSQRKVKQLEQDCQRVLEKRKSDRMGRIRAEQQLRHIIGNQVVREWVDTPRDHVGGSEGECGNIDNQSLKGVPWYPLVPIGTVESCFKRRHGTPRQPSLVRMARCRLTLRSALPAACLHGLEQYSHCWLIYVFHENTDLHMTLGQAAVECRGVKGKVRVPRLNGQKMGVLATRTPHRPCPIGLTLATIELLGDRTLVLSGTDLVDGTPVLDVKPYVPFSDAPLSTHAPDWVVAEAANEPLHIRRVTFSDAAIQQLQQGWRPQHQQHSLYSGPSQLHKLIQEVLERDIRSAHRRQENAQSDVTGQDHGPGQEVLHVDIVQVRYDVFADKTVIVQAISYKNADDVIN